VLYLKKANNNNNSSFKVEIQALDMSFETIRNFTDSLEFAVDLEMVPLGSKANGTVTVILDETSSSISLGVSTIFTMEGASKFYVSCATIN